MELELNKPIIFFDLETTGLSFSKDRIIEIGMIKVESNGKETRLVQRFNPGMPIPPESTYFHGISDEDVKDEPSFKDFAPKLLNFIGQADLAGYNSDKFDVPMLVEEFLRNGFELNMKNRLTIDVQNIFHRMEQRTLKAAYKFYTGKKLVNAHTALADVEATYDVLKAQLDKYKDVEFEDNDGNISYPIVNDIKSLAEFTRYNRRADLAGQIIFNDEGKEVFNFGKYRGIPVEEVFSKEPQYFDWMMKADFPLYTKKVIQEIRLRAFNSK